MYPIFDDYSDNKKSRCSKIKSKIISYYKKERFRDITKI